MYSLQQTESGKIKSADKSSVQIYILIKKSLNTNI